MGKKKKPKKGFACIKIMKTDNPDSVVLLFIYLFFCNSAALNYCTKHHMAFIVHPRKDVGFDLGPSSHDNKGLMM